MFFSTFFHFQSVFVVVSCFFNLFIWSVLSGEFNLYTFSFFSLLSSNFICRFSINVLSVCCGSLCAVTDYPVSVPHILKYHLQGCLAVTSFFQFLFVLAGLYFTFIYKWELGKAFWAGIISPVDLDIHPHLEWELDIAFWAGILSPKNLNTSLFSISL